MGTITTVLTVIGGATTAQRYLRIYHLIQLIKSCRSPIIFVSISSNKRHSCVGVDHARSVIVSSLSVLSVVVRFLVVSVLQGHSPLLTNTTAITSVPGVVSDGGLRLDGDNLLDLVIVLIGGGGDDWGGSLSLWWGNI